MSLLSLRKNFDIFSNDIKLAHSLFSFPFVLASLIIAETKLSFINLLLILFSLTCARSFAMGMNRYVDRDIDQKNPRTSNRAIPAGKISSLSLLLLSLFFGGLFILSSLAYNNLTFYCSLPLLLVLGLYPFTKRWTALCHLYLGFCLALSPIAASIALEGSVPLSSYLIALALLFWVSAFDIIYATQDFSFDQKEKINSIPGLLGIQKALKVSQIFFVIMILSLVFLGYIIGSGLYYNIGLIIITGILFFEHYSLSKRKEYTKIDPIFFTANAWVSVIFLVFVILDYYLK